MVSPKSNISRQTQRRPTNVSLDRALVDEARSMGINLSQACERGISEQVAKTRAKRWMEESREALASSNALVEARSLPLAAKRQF